MPIANQHIEAEQLPQAEEPQIELHSDEVHEILSYVPNWLIRWGITVIFLNVGLLIGLTYFIKYPDVVPGRISLTTTDAPVNVIPRTSGAVNLFVKDKRKVNKGDKLAFIENTVAYGDVKRLKEGLNNFKSRLDIGNVAGYRFNEGLKLGSLQSAYNRLINSVKERKLVNTTARNNDERKQYYEQRMRELEEDKADLQIQLANVDSKYNPTKLSFRTNDKREKVMGQIGKVKQVNDKYRQQIKSLQAKYASKYEEVQTRYKPLAKQGAISQVEYEKKVEEAKAVLEEEKQVETRIDDNQSQIKALERSIVEIEESEKRQREMEAKELLDMEAQARDEKIRLEREFNQIDTRITEIRGQVQELKYDVGDRDIRNTNAIEDAYIAIVGQVNEWEENYIVTAPIKGRINYMPTTKENMFVKLEQPIFTILPNSNNDTMGNKIYGELFIAERGSGKVKEEQKVNIELDSYMKKEFGMLIGEVISIADLTTDNMYEIRVDLKEGMKTTTKENIPFKHNMQGNAEIITENVRLIDRIFNEIRQVFDE